MAPRAARARRPWSSPTTWACRCRKACCWCTGAQGEGEGAAPGIPQKHRGCLACAQEGGGDGPPPTEDSVGAVMGALSATGLDVVLDAGVVRRCGGVDPLVVAVAAADHSLMVVRPCYLVLRAGVATEERPDGVVVVEEPGRALVSRDVADVLAAPVMATVPLDPAVARAVDAGVLARRLPRVLVHALKDLV